MVNREHKKVRKHVDTLDITYSTLGALRDEVAAKIEKYGEDATIDTYSYAYDPKDYEGGVYAEVLETDAERDARVAQEEHWEKVTAERDAKEFARLKAKFGA